MKQKYVPGFWNVNTIRMGGLGKDPELEGNAYFIYFIFTKILDVCCIKCWKI